MVKKQDIFTNLIKIAEIIKSSNKLVAKKRGTVIKKKWTGANFGPKIGTVALKAGQFKDMILTGHHETWSSVHSKNLVSTWCNTQEI